MPTRFRPRFFLAIILFAAGSPVWAQAPQSTTPATPATPTVPAPPAVPVAPPVASTDADAAASRVQTTARALAKAYDPTTGTFTGTGWWNSANGLTALADAARALHSPEFDSIFPNTYTAAQRQAPGFRNQFYDDEGWWALAWLDVYRLHPEPRYLAIASSIFDNMTTGWSPACGGGLWWKKDVQYKNAIPNELFLAVAVGLAQATPEGPGRTGYLDWAQKEKSWFLASGMINSDSLVNDGLTADCKNNGRATWTYNQGVLVGGLTGLYALTGDPADLATATRIANAAATRLTDPAGVLHDAAEPHCGPDAIQFKGILARDVVPLQQIAPSPAVQHALDASATSAWTRAQTPSGAFACSWTGPARNDETGALISVLDLFTADLVTASPGPSAAGR